MYNNLTELIKKVRQDFVTRDFAKSFKEINNGECIYFSEVIRKLFEGTCKIINSDTFLAELGWGEHERNIWIKSYLNQFGSYLPNGLSCKDLSEISFGYHQWIYFEGKHYDSECPEGISSLFELPFYKRYLEEYI